MATLRDLRGLAADTVKVGSLDVPIRGLTLEEWAALEARFPDLEGVLAGKAKPSPATLAGLVTPGLTVNGEEPDEDDVRQLSAGVLMQLGNAVMVATFPQVRAPLEAALLKAGQQRVGAEVGAPNRRAKRSQNSSQP